MAILYYKIFFHFSLNYYLLISHNIAKDAGRKDTVYLYTPLYNTHIIYIYKIIKKNMYFIFCI